MAALQPLRTGARIQNYRNARPRIVGLIGVGEGGRDVARRIAGEGLGSVTVTEEADGRRLPLLSDPARTPRPNLIVVIYRNGDEVDLPTLPERADPSVTFILLDRPSGTREPDERLRVLRTLADLCVTTSDEDFAFELVRNLAS